MIARLWCTIVTFQFYVMQSTAADTPATQKQNGPQAQSSAPTELSQQKSNRLFRLQSDKVTIPEWDSAHGPQRVTLLELAATKDFDRKALVYRERAILEIGSISTREFKVPDADEVVLIARSTSAEDLFSRISVKLEYHDATTVSKEIYAGVVASHTLTEVKCNVPRDVVGRTARINIELLNPSSIDDHRVLYVASIVFRRVAGSTPSASVSSSK
ncbi:MAG: hypothetical protein ACR2IE_09595 [Candidatus Sumerlaeaceae bacterium]